MIGKSRKFSEKIMPDFSHAAETMGQSEGCLGSVRVGTEMDTPKTKYVSISGDSRDQFLVPIRVLSLYKMTKVQREELEVSLKRELEDVRILLAGVASLSKSSVVSPLENATRVAERVPQGKKRPYPGCSEPRLNKGFSGSVDPPRQAVHTNSFDPFMVKLCSNLLSGLLTHKLGWVFKDPVDIVKLNIPDYFNVIKHPMDFTTIKNKLAGGEYTSPVGFAADVRLTFSNAMTYNPPKNDVHIMAQTLSKYFEQRWKNIEKKIPMYMDVPRLPSRMDVSSRVRVAMEQIPPSIKKKVSPVGYIAKPEPEKSVDKHKVKMDLEESLADLPESIINFLKEHSSDGGQTDEDEIEIDIDALSDDIVFKLRKLLDDFLIEQKKQQFRVEPCEMELHNEPGLSNSSLQPGKGNGVVDEDIDIGGSDHPVSSVPVVEIVKDTPKKASRGSRSSHSIIGSGSSSDSDRSSNESEVARVVPRGDNLQGTLDAKPTLDQHLKSVSQEVARDQSGYSLSQVEQTFHTKFPPAKSEGNKEGGNVDSERQVSPDKMYRAALLRSRYADTILKAQEKTLEKCEKRDPEKLRLEREELERKQREEKARLHAEAKAAEEARRKAELKAAAEAKRKRDLERDAARLALQKMEKTVEINENCQLMEELELLSAVPADDTLSFIGNSSPNDTQNDGLGSFIFHGNSNPLEKLGLFRKDDDEEEEEVEAHHGAPCPTSNDVVLSRAFDEKS